MTFSLPPGRGARAIDVARGETTSIDIAFSASNSPAIYGLVCAVPAAGMHLTSHVNP